MPRVAFTLEQCWHRVPGGTAVAALALAQALLARPDDVELVAVAGRHRTPPEPPYTPPVPTAELPLASPWLYESWHRLRWPAVERATGPVDVTHATTLAIPPTRAPLVVTIHDLAFLHQPEHFTRHGLRFFQRGLALARRHARLVLCSSQATLDDCRAAGFESDRLRLVPLGVEIVAADPGAVAEARRRHGRYVLWTGTIEPRKNLPRLLQAFEQVAGRHDDVHLVLVGPTGWNEDLGDPGDRVELTGFVSDDELRALYAGAAVFCYPSLLEGFGLPVLEAMAQGAPVVTSSGTSTAELAEGEAALAVDPTDVDAIAAAIDAVLTDDALADRLRAAGRRRAAGRTWAHTADRTVAAYREAADTADAPGRGGMSLVGVNLCWMVPGAVGGTEAYLARLLEGIAERPPAFDYRLFVLPGFREVHPSLAQHYAHDVAPVSGGRRSLRVAAESTWLSNRARRARVDLMHHGGGTVPPGPRRPTVLTIHDLQYLAHPAFFSATKRRYLETVMPRSARRSDVIITPSAFVRETVVEHLAVPADRVVVVPIPVELHPPEPAPADEVRRRYTLDDRPFFLYPAITYPHKNHLVLVEAMTAVVDRHPEAVLVLTGGTGSAEAALEAEVFRRNLTAHVRRPGRVPATDLERLYLEATAMVMPSRYEGFGAPVVEAMQRRCPVVAADATALSEVVEGAGILVDPDDAEGWADALCRLLDDERVGAALAEQGADHATRFAADRAAAVLEEAYRQALS